MRRPGQVTERDVLLILKEVRANEAETTWQWATESKIAEIACKVNTRKTRREVRTILRKLRKRELVQVERFSGVVAWRLVNER